VPFMQLQLLDLREWSCDVRSALLDPNGPRLLGHRRRQEHEILIGNRRYG